MLYLPISKSWIVSLWARRVYLVCSLISFYLLAAVMAILAAIVASGLPPHSDPPPNAALLIQVLVFPGVIGAAVLWVAMWYFWFTFDNSGWLLKAVWCCLFLFFAFFASPFYYFFVYRRSSVVRSL
jgi:hypothetical protein